MELAWLYDYTVLLFVGSVVLFLISYFLDAMIASIIRTIKLCSKFMLVAMLVLLVACLFDMIRKMGMAETGRYMQSNFEGWVEVMPKMMVVFRSVKGAVMANF